MTDLPSRHATHLKADRAYRIEPAADPSYTPQLGALVDMMVYCRLTTLQAALGLSTAELDAVPPGLSNSIGMLLAHIAAVDRIYQGISFDGHDPFEDAEFSRFRGALTLGEQGGVVRGRSLDDHVRELEESRAVTLTRLAERDDDWLRGRLTCPGYEAMNHHWAWFHVMEDEVSHRGQIRVLRRLIRPQPAAPAVDGDRDGDPAPPEAPTD